MAVKLNTGSSFFIQHLVGGESTNLREDIRFLRLTQLIEKLRGNGQSCSLKSLLDTTMYPKKETEALLSKMEKQGHIKVK